ncbi:MAG: FKBP-type peptidyl-prolyl cis-trans isomerase [Bacteroidota bacterium]
MVNRSTLTFGQVPGYQELSVETNGSFYNLQMKVHQSDPAGRKIKLKDFVTFHLVTTTQQDSLLRSTYRSQPLIKEISIDDYNYADKGFMEEMLMQLSVGDSATFLVNSGDLFQAIKRKRPTFLPADSYLKYHFKILKTQNELEIKRDRDEVVFQQMKADQKLIAPFIAKNYPKAKKKYSGLWYDIQVEGEGDFARENDVVAVRYEGRFLDGQVFASSDRDGRHFEFPVNQGFAIKGLDEGIMLLKEGGKATFIIPSGLAFAAEGLGDKVGPHTVVVYDIELIEIVSRQILIENKRSDEGTPIKKELSLEEKIKLIEKDAKKRKLEGNNKKNN